MRLSEKEKKENVERWLEERSHEDKKIVVLVEGLGDQTFWMNILTTTIPNLSYKDIFFPYARTNGINAIMPYQNCLSKAFVLCRDSDNVHLYNPTEVWLNTPFLYQTYTYTKENQLFYAQNLSKISYELTLETFDFADFLDEYSRLTFPVLLNWLHFFPQVTPSNHIPLISEAALSKVLSIKKEMENLDQLSNLKACLNNLKIQVKDWLERVENEFGYEASTLEQEIEIKNLLPEQAIFYLSGHIMLSEVIEPLFKKVILLLSSKHEKILTKNLNDTISENRLQEYKNSIRRKNVDTLLQESYKECFKYNVQPCTFIAQIKAKIERDFK
jgi:Protein of unknown function (DUF4435)